MSISHSNAPAWPGKNYKGGVGKHMKMRVGFSKFPFSLSSLSQHLICINTHVTTHRSLVFFSAAAAASRFVPPFSSFNCRGFKLLCRQLQVGFGSPGFMCIYFMCIDLASISQQERGSNVQNSRFTNGDSRKDTCKCAQAKEGAPCTVRKILLFVWNGRLGGGGIIK